MVPSGFKEDSVKFDIADVADSKVAKQLTELVDGTEYIIKEVLFSNWDTTIADGYAHLNSAATDDDVNDIGTRFGSTYFQDFSAIIFDGDSNGKLGGSLTAKPYVHASCGTGASTTTIHGVVKYYYR